MTNSVKLRVVKEPPFSDASFWANNGDYRFSFGEWEIISSNQIQNAFHLQGQEVYVIVGDRVEKRGGPGQPPGPDSEGLISVTPSEGDIGISRGVVVGIPFTRYLRTLPFITPDQIVDNKPKRSFSVGLRCLNSSSMNAGIVGNLYPVIFDDNGEPKTSFSDGVFNVNVASEWEYDDQLEVESDLPFNLVGLVISFDAGDEERNNSRVPNPAVAGI